MTNGSVADTRVAVCFHGLIGGTAGKDGRGGQLNPWLSGEFAQLNLLKPNPADAFIHTWTRGLDHDLENIYQPKGLQIDPPLTPRETNRTLPLCHRLWRIQGSRGKRKLSARHRAISRFTSATRCLQLVLRHEADFGVSYDRVLFARFDVAHLRPLEFWRHRSDSAYVSHWNRAPGAGSEQVVEENLNAEWGCLDFWISVPRSSAVVFAAKALDLSLAGLNPHRATFQALAATGLRLRHEGYRGLDVEMMRRLLGAAE